MDDSSLELLFRLYRMQTEKRCIDSVRETNSCLRGSNKGKKAAFEQSPSKISWIKKGLLWKRRGG